MGKTAGGTWLGGGCKDSLPASLLTPPEKKALTRSWSVFLCASSADTRQTFAERVRELWANNWVEMCWGLLALTALVIQPGALTTSPPDHGLGRLERP